MCCVHFAHNTKSWQNSPSFLLNTFVGSTGDHNPSVIASAGLYVCCSISTWKRQGKILIRAKNPLTPTVFGEPKNTSQVFHCFSLYGCSYIACAVTLNMPHHHIVIVCPLFLFSPFKFSAGDVWPRGPLMPGGSALCLQSPQEQVMEVSAPEQMEVQTSSEASAPLPIRQPSGANLSQFKQQAYPVMAKRPEHLRINLWPAAHLRRFFNFLFVDISSLIFLNIKTLETMKHYISLLHTHHYLKSPSGFNLQCAAAELGRLGHSLRSPWPLQPDP